MVEDTMDKCAAVKAYVACLETATVAGQAGCPIAAANAAIIQTDYAAIATCDLGALCTCQKDFFKEDLSDATGKCTALQKRFGCIKGKADSTDCGTGSTVKTLAENTDTLYTVLTCTALGADTTCKCEADYVKADISDNPNKCTALKNEISCLVGKSGTGCDGTTTLIEIATAAETAIGTTTDCTIADPSTCKCELDYAKADVSDNTQKCTELKKLTSCIRPSFDNGCGASATRNSIGTIIETEATDCTKTSNCDCEIAFAKADVSDNPNKCTALKALTKCLQTSVADGCGTSATRMAIGTNVQTLISAITPASDCAISAACQCQINFVKADVSAASKCTAISDLGACADNITDTAITTCDGTTLKDHLKSNISSALSASECTSGSTNDLPAVPAVTLLVALIVSIFAM